MQRSSLSSPCSFSKRYYEAPLLKGEREDEVKLIGTEVNFTLFRNVETGAVVELVDTEDVPGLAGSRGYGAMGLCLMDHGSMRLSIYASMYLLCSASHVCWGYGSDEGYASMRLYMYPCIHLCLLCSAIILAGAMGLCI